jgi:hypothetical protein
VINRGNGRATIFHKPQDYFGLRLFQTFQTPALSSIEGFNRFASFITGSVVRPFQSFNRFASFKRRAERPRQTSSDSRTGFDIDSAVSEHWFGLLMMLEII